MSTGALWGTVGVRGVSVLMAAANLVVIARMLGPSGRGLLAVLEATSGLLVICAGQWLGSLNNVRAARDASLLDRLLRLSCWWAFGAGTALALLAVASFPLLRGVGFDNIATREFAAAMAAIPAQLFNTAALGLALGAGRIRAFNVLTLVQSNAYLPALGVLVGLARYDLFSLVAAAAAVHYAIAAGSILYFRFNRGTGRAEAAPVEAVDARATARFGGKLVAVNVLAFIAMRSGVLLLNAGRGEHEVGLYAVAARIADLVMLAPTTASALLIGRLSRLETTPERHAETMRFFRMLGAVVAGLSLAAALSGPILIPMVFGSAFASSYQPMLLLLPGLFFLTLQMVLGQYLAVLEIPRAVVWTWLASSLANVLLNIVLIPWGGASAVAVAASLTYVLLAAGMVQVYRKHALATG